MEAAVDSPPSPAHHVLVATEGSTTVGFAAVGPSAEEDARPGEAEVAALLVEPRWGRRGHGSRLLAAAVDFLRQDGVTGLVAWVPDGDRASTAFYESAGWDAGRRDAHPRGRRRLGPRDALARRAGGAMAEGEAAEDER